MAAGHFSLLGLHPQILPQSDFLISKSLGVALVILFLIPHLAEDRAIHRHGEPSAQMPWHLTAFSEKLKNRVHRC